jgi:two-component system chemotaxis response regulator CheB
MLVVLHVPPNGRSVLPDILERASGIPAAHPRDREPMIAGHLYVAPPDRHLLVHDGIVRVTRGPWENGYRPSVDALFRSAARWYGPQVVGVVLSGALDDGAAGLASVHEAGGAAIVQDPRDAMVAAMPEHALDLVPGARVLPVSQISAANNALDPPPRSAAAPPPTASRDDAELAALQGVAVPVEAAAVGPAGLVCPDCGGSLFQVSDDGLRFRCRVGHGWTAEALSDAHGRQLEQALWAAVRVLEENDAVDRRLVDRARETGRRRVEHRIQARQHKREHLASTLRAAIDQFGSAIPGDEEPDAVAAESIVTELEPRAAGGDVLG